jgi:hypothetical protein
VGVFTRKTSAEAWSPNLPLKTDSSPASFTRFGAALSISDSAAQTSVDIKYLLVGAPGRSSSTTGGSVVAGTAYLFTLFGNSLASSPDMIRSVFEARDDQFGAAVALSSDGSTVVVGAPGEDTFVSRGSASGDGTDSGAIFVYRRLDVSSSSSRTPAFIKAKFPGNGARYGSSISISANGDTIAVGAPGESGLQAGVDSDGDSAQSAPSAGAVDIVLRGNKADWSSFTSPTSQFPGALPTKRYIKASNTTAEDRFGTSVYLSKDGNTLVVGAPNEDSNYVNFDPDQSSLDNSLSDAGAAYLY